MSYRIRPSSKNSQQTEQDKVSERSMVQLNFPRTLQPSHSNSPNFQEIRSLSIRLQNMENNVINLQDLWRRQRDISNAGYLDVQKKLDLIEYKTFTNEKDIKQLNNQILSNSGNKSSEYVLSDSARASQNQIIMLKQLLNQQRQNQKDNTKHHNQKLQQLSMKQLKMEQQIKELISQQHEEQAYIVNSKFEDLKNYEAEKSMKINNQHQYIRNMINNSERKMLDELDRKLRNQTVIKDYIQDKIDSIREQMAIEHKGMLSKEGKFIKQIKQSIQAVFAMAKNIRKQFTNQLAETQKLAAANFKKLSMSVDLLKQKTHQQISDINEQSDEIKNEILDLKNYVNTRIDENRQMIMEIEDQALERSTIKQGSRALQTSNRYQDKSQSLAQLQKQMQNWKTITQQKNLNVFKQISAALKTMKIEWKKQNDEVTSLISSYEENLTGVKKSVPLEIKKSIQAIITIFNNEFDTLAQQLDTITEMIALSKKQTEKSYKQDIKDCKNEIIKKIEEMIKTSQNQATLNTQKSLRKQEETMKLYIEGQLNFVRNMFNQKQASLQTQIGQVSTSSKKNHLNTNNQLQDFTLKLKNFNQNYKDYLEEQRKDDMKKRLEMQQSIRKNTSSMMDIYYKKCQFLVDGMKQAIQMNQLKDKTQLDRSIDIIKQQNQKKSFQMKEQLINDINQKLDKMAEEKQSSEQVMHEAFDQQLNNLKKTLSIEIGNNKLEIGEKINQLVETINQLQNKGSNSSQELAQALQTAKQAIWKLEARTFAQQAKNKALMDRFGQDINDLSLNMTILANQLAPNNSPKKSVKQ